MQTFRIMFLSLALILSLFTGLFGCGIGGEQREVDRVTQALALTVRTFISFFEEDLGSCGDFIQIYDDLTEQVQTCDNGDAGTFQVTKISVICESGPPLTGSIEIILNQENCQDDGTEITSTGTMNMTLNFSSAGNIGTLASEDLLAQGIAFIFDNFQSRVDLSNNNLSCADSGDLNANGENCNVASDCGSCSF